MPLKAAICDDEPEQAGMLERYIKEWAVSSDIKIETRIFPVRRPSALYGRRKRTGG